MNHSERYVPPPPPYQFSLQHDRKVDDEQVLELSKGGPFPEDEKDSKHARSPTPPSTPKDPVKSVSGNSRAQRPLPPRPAGTRPFGPRTKSGSAADIKPRAAQNDYSTKPHAPVLPSFSAIRPSYTQSVFLPDHPSPLQQPSQSQASYDTSRQTYDDRRPVSSYSLMEPYAESSFRRPSHMSSQLPRYFPPQNGARLVFDPSVAYSDSQANTRITQGGVTASSFYSSSVSSHLHPDSAMVSGSHQLSV
ncbi:hypothetical protein HD554DRAFT_2047060 [Boletus coccyginus]|nr:hypothetical protein HD554DRAFT_2047060 [Boletus coccyginus]